MNNFGYSYTTSLIRMMVFVSILICGSTVRYKTLFDRERKKIFDIMTKQRDEIQRYIVYSYDTIPIALICAQVKDSSDISTFTIQLCHINSKFHDYFNDIANYTSRNLIECTKAYAKEHKRSIHIKWSLPTCKSSWKFAMKHNKFVLKDTYEDFSFLPLVNSQVEEYEYKHEYTYEPPTPIVEAIINE